MKLFKKTILFTLIVVSLISVFAFNNSNIVRADAECSNYNELSITLLHPYIEKAIENYYGYNRRYEIGDSQIEILERKGNTFIVEVKVDTFEGAHNNYFTEILTFNISPNSVTLNSYLHSEFFK